MRRKTRAGQFLRQKLVLKFLGLAEIRDWQWGKDLRFQVLPKTCPGLRLESRGYRDYPYISRRLLARWSEDLGVMFLAPSAPS